MVPVTPDDFAPTYAFHFTGDEGMTGILRDGYLRPSRHNGWTWFRAIEHLIDDPHMLPFWADGEGIFRLRMETSKLILLGE